ncbi:hypothetical protein ACQP00_36650 [Dactylosporangium sp. CS-047395]|uniref:hypothetical protein n=1 Tax=Dactylosporangium sp. CS-047395 TaxID=3239936 RepID=UPI003D910ABF
MSTRNPPEHVDEPRGELPLLFAVGTTGTVEPPQQRPEDDAEDDDARRHDQRDHPGDLAQEGQNHGVGDHSTGAGPGHIERAGNQPHVADADGDDLTGGDTAREGRSECHTVFHDRIDRSQRTVEPDLGHGAVPEDAQDGVGQAYHEDRGGPGDEGAWLLGAQTTVDRLGDQVRRDREADHPERTPERAQRGAPPLLPGQPSQIPSGPPCPHPLIIADASRAFPPRIRKAWSGSRARR